MTKHINTSFRSCDTTITSYTIIGEGYGIIMRLRNTGSSYTKKIVTCRCHGKSIKIYSYTLSKIVFIRKSNV